MQEVGERIDKRVTMEGDLTWLHFTHADASAKLSSLALPNDTYDDIERAHCCFVRDLEVSYT